jgi:hypothetical protein
LADSKDVTVYYDTNRNSKIGCNLALEDGRNKEVPAAQEGKAGQSNPMSSVYLSYPTSGGP